MADDFSLPVSGAAALEGDALGVADAGADVLVADSAVGVKDVLVDDGFRAPFPLA